MHDLVASWLDGRVADSLAIQLDGLELVHSLFCEVNPIPVKAALAMMGMIEEQYRLPLTPMAPANRDRLEAAVKAAGLM